MFTRRIILVLFRFASELTSVEEVRKKILEIEKEFDLGKTHSFHLLSCSV